MLYKLVCQNCKKESEADSKTDGVFSKAMNEGFKIKSSVEPIEKNGQTGSIITYIYECPTCKSNDIKLTILEDNGKKEKWEYLFNKTSNTDAILKYISKFEDDYSQLIEIYSNEKVESGKNNISILKDDNFFYIKVMRVVEDSWINIQDYSEDNIYIEENLELTETVLDMDDVFELFDQEYNKNLMYNFYVVRFKNKQDLFKFCDQTLNNKENFDIKNKLKKGGDLNA